MKRRDFNRLAVGDGVSPICDQLRRSLKCPAEEMQLGPKRSHQQSLSRILHGPTIRSMFHGNILAGRRRFTIYWTWSYPWEANAM